MACQVDISVPTSIGLLIVFIGMLWIIFDGWTEMDGAFDMSIFYNSVVSLFKSYPNDEWALNTLAWWNE